MMTLTMMIMMKMMSVMMRVGRMFGFISRKPSGGNECHVLAEYDPEQPAADVVDFVQKVIASKGRGGNDSET